MGGAGGRDARASDGGAQAGRGAALLAEPGGGARVALDTGRYGRTRTAERRQPVDVAALLARIDLRTAAGARDAALLALVCGAGLRASEASRLTVEDVDLRAGVVTVGANGHSRFVPVTGAEQAALARWLAVRRAVGAQDGALFVGLHRAGTGAALGETGARWVVRKWTGTAQDGQDAATRR